MRWVRRLGRKYECEEAQWLYVLQAPLFYKTPVLGIDFENDFMRLMINGHLTLKVGMKSDGCTPGWVFFDFLTVKVPDGPRDSRGRPITFRAFYAHDAFARVYEELGIDPRIMNAYFGHCLRQERRWWLTGLYDYVVNRLGPK